MDVVGSTPIELDVRFVASKEKMAEEAKKGFVRYRTALHTIHGNLINDLVVEKETKTI